MKRQVPTSAFTLAELLISIALVVVVLTFVMQIISGTASTIATSNKQIDTASLARITLDRFDNDFSGARLGNGATLLYYSEPEPPSGNGNSALAFVTGSRARGPTTQTDPWTTDTRGAFIGYRVRGVAQYIGGSSPTIPCLNRGDGRFTISVADIGSLATQNLWDVFGATQKRIPNDLTASSDDQHVLNWQPIANGIFRLHTSFLLSNGHIVQTPPTYRNFSSNGGVGSCVAVAFSKQTSADVNQAYVTGLIIGVAALDESTRNLAYRMDSNFWNTISTKISRPTNDGETPVQFWSQKLLTLTSNNPGDPNYLFPPVRQNIRFYQRFYRVNQ